MWPLTVLSAASRDDSTADRLRASPVFSRQASAAYRTDDLREQLSLEQTIRYQGLADSDAEWIIDGQYLDGDTSDRCLSKQILPRQRK
jgi:hypothetical protein